MSVIRLRRPKLRPLIKRHGGKFYLAVWINEHLPPHETYVEPYLGGANVLLNKPRSPVEIVGDTDEGLVNLYRVIRDRPEVFLRRVEGLGYDREGFEAANRVDNDPVGQAVAYLVRQRFSRGGGGMSFSKSNRDRGGMMGDANAWRTLKPLLPRIAYRFRGVMIECRRALDVIRQYDSPTTLNYLDPPYLHETRTHRRAYGEHEMTDDDHRELLDCISSCRGGVVLSGYPSSMYDERLAGWDRDEVEVPNNSGQGRTKGRRVEVLWIKPPAFNTTLVASC